MFRVAQKSKVKKYLQYATVEKMQLYKIIWYLKTMVVK